MPNTPDDSHESLWITRQHLLMAFLASGTHQYLLMAFLVSEHVMLRLGACYTVACREEYHRSGGPGHPPELYEGRYPIQKLLFKNNYGRRGLQHLIKDLHRSWSRVSTSICTPLLLYDVILAKNIHLFELFWKIPFILVMPVRVSTQP